MTESSNPSSEPEAAGGEQQGRPVGSHAGAERLGVVSAQEDARLAVELEADRTINLAQKQCGVPVIKRLALVSRHPSLIEDVRVRVEIEDEVAEVFETVVDRLPAGHAVKVPDADLELRPAVLRQRTEREASRIVVTVDGVALDPPPGSEEEGVVGGPVRVCRIEPVDVLAWNEWGGCAGLPEVLASFVQPNDPFVAKVLQASRAPLEARVGDDAFDGYQAKDPNRVIDLVGAIFEGAASFRIGYLSTAASFEEHGQKVRLPETLEQNCQGNCLDLTLLLAGACEQAGLHPLLVLVEGHIVLGVWTSETCFAEATVESASRVLNRAANREILLVESTGITHGERADFEGALHAAHQKVKDHRDSLIAVDVQRARKMRYLPLSSRPDGRTSDVPEAASAVPVSVKSRGASTIAVPMTRPCPPS